MTAIVTSSIMIRFIKAEASKMKQNQRLAESAEEIA
jgi:hypothetical protein